MTYIYLYLTLYEKIFILYFFTFYILNREGISFIWKMGFPFS